LAAPGYLSAPPPRTDTARPESFAALCSSGLTEKLRSSELKGGRLRCPVSHRIQEETMGKTRLEAFSDGVIAILITSILLVKTTY
jgi:hypothetical protein